MQRVAIVGHTGRGNYGHYLDEAFAGVDGAGVVAVAAVRRDAAVLCRGEIRTKRAGRRRWPRPAPRWATPITGRCSTGSAPTSPCSPRRAYYQFPGGFAADFESYEGDHDSERPYRIDIHGTEGTISLPGPMSNQPDIYFHPRVAPRLFDDDRWQVIPAEPVPDDHKWGNAHHRMAKAMIDRIEGREPEFELLEGKTARRHVAWAMAAHAAHMAGARVTLPLATAHNPFDSWQP